MVSISGLSVDGVSFTENALAGSHAHVHGIRQLATGVDSRVGRMLVLSFENESLASEFAEKKIKVLKMTISNGRVLGETRPGVAIKTGEKVTVIVRR